MKQKTVWARQLFNAPNDCIQMRPTVGSLNNDSYNWLKKSMNQLLTYLRRANYSDRYVEVGGRKISN
jgi:hypothetical protein